MSQCSPTFLCRGDWFCFNGTIPYRTIGGLTGCYLDSSEYGCEGGSACSRDCSTALSGCNTACLPALKICEKSCALAFDTCFQRCLGDALCEAACRNAANTCGNGCANTNTSCLDSCNTDNADCLSACTDAIALCQSDCSDAESVCSTSCNDANIDCHTTCSDAQTSCVAACAGDPGCITACNDAYSSCAGACDATYAGCLSVCASNYADCSDACPVNTCGELADDTAAKDCFVDRADCQLDGCNRSLSTCLKSATEQLITDYFDADEACIACKQSAQSTLTSCSASCVSTYDTCFDGCAGDPDCEAACSESYDACACACNATNAQSLVGCDSDHYVSIREYRLAVISCQIAEGRRTASDNGIDSKDKWCGASSLDCRRDCYGDRESAYDAAQYEYFTCIGNCYDECGVLDADCSTLCDRTLAKERADADNQFDDCSRFCCQEWTKPFADDDAYENAAAICAETNRSCVASCTGMTGPDYTDCTDDCADAYDTCRDLLPQKPAACVDCAFMAGTGYENPYVAAEIDFTPIIERCNCSP